MMHSITFKQICVSTTALLCTSAFSSTAGMQISHTNHGDIYWPASSLPTHDSNHAHTNYAIFKPNSHGNSYSIGETPGSLACIYSFTPRIPGCPIRSTTQVVTRGNNAKVIGIVDAYDNPEAERNLNVYSRRYGLPECTTLNGCLTIVYASGSKPAFNYDWAKESSLDIEMAHAMAPNAKIILVEADDNKNDNLYVAEDVASNLVSAQGGGEISNSWSHDEQPSELNLDSHFQTPGILYFASTGDSSAPAGYPSTSPYVIAAGGTTIVRDNQGNMIKETGWSRRITSTGPHGGGGGPSLYEPRPHFQRFIASRTGNMRGTPDMAFDANPESGVWIYDNNTGGTTCNGWCIIGGTSVSSPALAGIFNATGPYSNLSTQLELEYTYFIYLTRAPIDWHDINEGDNGYPALLKYDFVTGLGSPNGYGGK